MNTKKLSLGLAILMIQAVAVGQFNLVHVGQGTEPGESFGYAVAGIGDVNGDFVPDYIVGSNRADPAGYQSGKAQVFSGADHSLLYQFNGENIGDFFGTSVGSLGDVTGDGVPEFMVGAPGSGNVANLGAIGYVKVYSGSDGSLVHQFTGGTTLENFGFSISRNTDMNGDGVEDIMVGAPGYGLFDLNHGHVYFYSGLTGDLFLTLDGPVAASNFGRSVAGLGDITEDGVGDYIIGSPLEPTGVSLFAGGARVYSGADHSVLRFFDGGVNYASNRANVGFQVANIGDVDGDGCTDFAIGSRYDNLAGFNMGSANVFSGKLLAQIRSFVGPNTSSFSGFSIDAAGDVNGDGFADVIISSPISGFEFTDGGYVRVFSGSDSTILFEKNVLVVSDFFGFDASGVGDLNADGFDDFIVGAPGFGADDLIPSRIEVFHSPELASRVYGSRLGETQLRLDWVPEGGDPLGLSARFIASGATPGSVGFFGISFAPGDFLLAPDLPLLLAVDSSNFIFAGAFGYNPMGKVQSHVFSRQIPEIAGSYLFYQFFEVSPFQKSSNGVRLLIAP